jgi:hypothetical protein
MATKTQTEYRIVVRDLDRTVLNAGVFLKEEDADKFAQNAGVGEGYTVEKFIETNTVNDIDWEEIKMEKWRDEANEYYAPDED